MYSPLALPTADQTASSAKHWDGHFGIHSSLDGAHETPSDFQARLCPLTNVSMARHGKDLAFEHFKEQMLVNHVNKWI